VRTFFIVQSAQAVDYSALILEAIVAHRFRVTKSEHQNRKLDDMEPKKIKLEEYNKSIIEQMNEATRQKGLTAQADFFADEVINHGMPVSHEAIRAVLQDICTTFPDVVLEPIQILAEGEWVAMRCYFSGTHKGVGQHPFVHEGLLTNIPPTGKSIKVQHIHMFRFKNGMIVEHLANRDDIGMMRQLGLLKP
jgi:predicted ester cyclase